MRILYKEPGKEARTMVVPNKLDVLQDLVGGYIETLTVGDIVIICNEEGKVKHMPLNFFVKTKAYTEAIVGPAIFCRTDRWEFKGLEAEDITHIKELMTEVPA